MKVSFYQTTRRGQKHIGEIRLAQNKLSFSGKGEVFGKILFQGIKATNIAALKIAMKDAPNRFDGVYLRAEFSQDREVKQ